MSVSKQVNIICKRVRYSAKGEAQEYSNEDTKCTSYYKNTATKPLTQKKILILAK